jgi:arylsulfatase A-like enzyme
MNRREFVRTSVAAGVAVSVPLADAAAPKKRMNVLYVFSDQHRDCSTPGKPFSPVKAPVMEKFARENFVVENCISNFPLCTPYRGIFMSGRWSQQTGLMGNGPALKASEYGLGQCFAEAGYHAGYIGKWHLNHDEGHAVPVGPLRFGFEDFMMWGNTNNHYHAPTFDPKTGEKIFLPGWSPTSMTTQAVEFLGKQKGVEKPWLLVISWNPPHPPFDPPAEDSVAYPEDGSLPRRPNVRLTQSDGTKPAWAQLKDEDALRKAEKGYYGGITGVDTEFGRILKTLEENGQAENTIVIYTSDHGEMMGSHARMSKIVPHEESSHVPFYVRIPGAKNRGGSTKELFSAIDIYPTLCGLAGIPVPKSCQGRDLSSVMRGETHGHTPSEGVFLLAGNHAASEAENDVPEYRGIRTPTHTYAVVKDGRWLLYDNVTDPFQKNNLAGDVKHEPLMKSLDAKISMWMKSLNDPFPLAEAVKQISKYPS